MNEALLRERFLEMVSEDVGLGDITTLFAPEKQVKAEILAKEAGIVSGIEELLLLFKTFNISAKPYLRDGAKTKKRQRIFLLKGSSRDILTVERTALNILSRMSGISTLTRKYVDSARKANPKIRVACTRKTTPLFAYFEKKAVKAGGGDTHRMNLEGMVLLKDNHLRLFKNVEEAVSTAKKETSFAYKVEAEVTKPQDALSAAEAGADIVMLDNMSPSEIKKTIWLLKKEGVRDKVLLEASGGITLENLSAYAKSGIDIVSVGRLTHSAPALDISLEVI